MTPKEKAQELVDRIDSKIVYTYKVGVAKKIALLLVDEIIESNINGDILKSNNVFGIDLVCYDCWLEVKHELEKL